MRKRTVTFLVIAMLVLTGCGADAPDEPRVADFSFALPQGASLADQTDTTAAIVMDGQTIGGIALTDVEGKSMDKLDDDSLFRYIDSCAPAPLMGEWISMYFEGEGYEMIRVNLKVTDTQTGAVSNYTHTLFMKEEGVYDLWFDDTLADEDLREQFFDLVVVSRGE